MTVQRDLFGLDPSPAKEEETVTLTLISQGDVGDAVKFSQTEDSETFLLPTSQIAVFNSGPTKTTHRLGHPKYPFVQVRMPLWLAKDRGLI
jgi:hypothetical protein